MGEQLTLLRRNLLHTLVRNDDLLLELGEHQAELVDALGIFDLQRYRCGDFPAARAAAGEARRGGGVSNMLTSSPQIDFAARYWLRGHPSQVVATVAGYPPRGRRAGKEEYHRGGAKGWGSTR